MGKALKKIKSAQARGSKCIVLLINQIRSGGIGRGRPSKITPGGNAMRFFPDIRIEITRPYDDLERDDDGDIIGQTVKYVVPKNKTFPPRPDLKNSHLYQSTKLFCLEPERTQQPYSQ